MKARRIKAYYNRELRIALLAGKRELGDHRRWWWEATLPLIIKNDPVFKCDVELSFDPRCGRLYRLLEPMND